ncbi:MAG: hypothetical protein AAF483_30945 [Planctomycetota bacterium]
MGREQTTIFGFGKHMSNEPQKTQPARMDRRQIPTPPSGNPALSRSMPAWLVSLIFHATVLTTLTVFWVGTKKGTGGEKDRPIGVAVVYKAAGKSEYLLNGTGESSSEDSATENLLPSADAADSDTQEAENMLQNLLPGTQGAGSEAASAAGSVGLGEGGGALGGSSEIPKVKTTVFGIEGEGRRFLYVFDCSDSMNGYGGSPFRAAKKELIQSLDSLGAVHQFQIIFYNDFPFPYGGKSRTAKLFRGESRIKEDAKRFVRDHRAFGSTVHIDALRTALSMGPDVIFFLTDADDSPNFKQLDDLKVRATRNGTTIHSIQFGSGGNASSGNWIKDLATGTLGEYRYVDVSKLGN